ncbi:hypothetical protein [Microbacterium sulfonylureivorans]|uniref:hypothetical protein n=1 Tax=Microbacterium sulfonylureivorans TaxID=2486854 RepID=UPI000FDAA487|nr:hypothetical protein [Microbacterium sulfonylureivorans]
MDAPSLTPERSRELDDLRRRAYGPDADIHRDPVAQQRLHELEELARVAAVDSDGGPAVEPPAIAVVLGEDPPRRDAAGDRSPEGEASAPPAADPDPSVAASESPPPGSRRRPWWRRIPLWSVAAVLGVAAGIAVGLAWQTDSEVPPDATLEVAPDSGARGDGFRENLDYWGIDGGSVVPHDAYDAIDVWTARSVDESRCLMLSYEGQFLSATCSGAGLDPILDFTVYDGMSIELETPLPVGTVIRFMGREGRVDVWVSAPGGQTGDAAATTSRTDSAPSAA